MAGRHRWERPWESHSARTSPRPVSGGIQAKGKFGQTWWGKRWIDVLGAFGWSNRLARGRSYARDGQIVGYEIGTGNVTAEVQGSQARPYAVTICIKKLSAADWAEVVAAMAEQALFAARLLAGEMPEQIEDAFEQAQVSLFPQSADDLRTTCTCPDWANPCKHVAAVYYLLGELFDVDPFMIFELRGLPREDLLAQLREARGVGEPPDDDPEEAEAAASEDEEAEEAVTLPIDRFWAGPPHLSLRIEKPLVESAVLKRLGEPAFWAGRVELTTQLAKTYRKASATAIKMAFAPRNAPTKSR